MLANGAIEEAQALLALGLDPSLPAMRAHGVPELSLFLHGNITLTEAARRAVLATGNTPSARPPGSATARPPHIPRR